MWPKNGGKIKHIRKAGRKRWNFVHYLSLQVMYHSCQWRPLHINVRLSIRTFSERRNDYEMKVKESREAWVVLWVGFEQKKGVSLFCWHTSFVTPSSGIVRKIPESNHWDVSLQDKEHLWRASVSVRTPHTYLMGHCLKFTKGRAVEHAQAKSGKLLENCRLFIQCIYHLIIFECFFFYHFCFDFLSSFHFLSSIQDFAQHAC